MMLCKCMNNDCTNKHWADLSDEEQADYEQQWHKDRVTEGKEWPPKTIETK